jgi:uncharacterized repeat protein (TIGR03809 family)
MADRQYECPVPRIPECNPSLAKAAAAVGRVALKWRALAERRRDHFVELQHTGRWKLYYDRPDFLQELRAAIALAQRWARIAPGDGAGAKTQECEGEPGAGASDVKAA